MQIKFKESIYTLIVLLLVGTTCQSQTVEVQVTREIEVTREVKAKGPEAQPSQPDLDIIMVQHALCEWDLFWCVVERGIADAARDLNVNVTVLGPDKFDLEQVARLIDEAAAAQPDGMGVTITDPVLFKEPLEHAIDAGIPVIGYNVGAGPRADGIPYLTYVGMDEYVGGYVIGQRLATQDGILGLRGVCINHAVGHVGLDARCQGFMDALTEYEIEAQVLDVTGADRTEMQTLIADDYAAHPETDIFFSIGPLVATALYAFMEDAGLEAGQVAHAAFDLTPETASRIKDGTTAFVIDQQPYLQGYMVVQWLTWVNRYGLTPPREITATGPGIIDKTNIDLVQGLIGTHR